jgi:hypothetical protein
MVDSNYKSRVFRFWSNHDTYLVHTRAALSAQPALCARHCVSVVYHCLCMMIIIIGATIDLTSTTVKTKTTTTARARRPPLLLSE